MSHELRSHETRTLLAPGRERGSGPSRGGVAPKRAGGLLELAVLTALVLACGAIGLRAQAPATSNQLTTSAGQSHGSSAAPAHRRLRKATPAKPSPATLAVPVAPVAPVAPPPPNWPINDKPVAATVTWDSRGLAIDADNSSLQQILKDVSTDTGAKVEGLDADQRVFGNYGPGPARQVLSQLLDGTGYNVLMFGDQGAGTPREVLLSAQPTGPAPAGSNRSSLANEEDYVEPEPEPMQQPEPVQNQFQPPAPQPGMPPRTPQEIQQLMQQRQQQMEQQQNENQQPNNQQ